MRHIRLHRRQQSREKAAAFCCMLAAMILIAGGYSGAQKIAAQPRVTIDAGQLAGMQWDENAKDVAFLGIPFAAQPVGKLRWQPPQPPAKWAGVRQAVAYGPACPQLPSGWLPEMLGRKELKTDEACLYLNVWTTNLHGRSKQPVMVWIHGGGNVEGSGEMPPLGPTLAKHGVVVVSIQYRLQALGFFSYAALAAESPHHASGNYGLLDQMEALRWVRRNIAKFGGDAKQVTIFGASSGSEDVCHLMASPLPTGLFQRAILQSGTCEDYVMPSAEQTEVSDARLLQDLGIQNGPHALDALRALPAERILQAAAKDEQLLLEPNLDGWVFRQRPAVTFAEGREADVPVMVGSNAQEVTIFASPIVGGSSSHRPKTIAEYKRWLQREFHGNADAVFAAYPARTDAGVPKVFVEMDTDSQFGFGAHLLAEETARRGQKAYLYHFTYVGAGKFAPLGAFHSEESILLSKKYWTTWVHRPEDEVLSNVLIGYWTQFAKTGNPNAAGLPAWHAFNPKLDQCQELGLQVGSIPVPHAENMQVFDRMLKAELQETH